MLSFKVALTDREWVCKGVVQIVVDCDIIRCYNNRL